MGLDGSWSFHPYLAVRLREMNGGFPPTQRPPRRRRGRRLARGVRAALRAVAALALLAVR